MDWFTPLTLRKHWMMDALSFIFSEEVLRFQRLVHGHSHGKESFCVSDWETSSGRGSAAGGMMGSQSHVYVCMHEVWDVIAEKPPGLSDERNTCVSENDCFLPDPVLSCCRLKLNTPNQHYMHYWVQLYRLPRILASHGIGGNIRKLLI